MRLVVNSDSKPLLGIVPGAIDGEAATYALAVAALASGNESVLRGRGLPELPIVAALRALGLVIEPLGEGGRHEGWRVMGSAPSSFETPAAPLDAGASRAAMVALSAIGAGLPFATQLVGDASTFRSGMASVARVLRMRGAQIEGVLAPRESPNGPLGALVPPIALGPCDAPLSPGSYEPNELEPDSPESVRAAALLSGVWATGATTLFERTVVDDVVARLLAAAGAELRAFGPMLELEGPVALTGLRGELPCDASFAAAVIAAGLHRPGQVVGVRRVPTRGAATGWLEALVDSGARLAVEAKGESLGQPAADVSVTGTLSRAVALGGERAERLGVALPVFAALAARGPAGVACALRDLLRSHAAMVGRSAVLLDAFGVEAATDGAGLELVGVGSARLRAAEFDCEGDADLALGGLVLALGATGRSVLERPGDLLGRYPRLLATFRALGAQLAVEGDATEAATSDGTP